MSARLEIAMAHRVLPGGFHDPHHPYAKTTLSIDAFEAYLQSRSAYTALSFNEIGVGPLPQGPVFALSFDDGYRDNLLHALPLLEKYNVPATIFITTSFIDGAAEPFEAKLYELLKAADMSEEERLRIYKEQVRFCKKGSLQTRLKFIKDIAALYQLPPPAIRHDDFLSWDEVIKLDRHPLITIGSHCLTHRQMGKALPWECYRELRQSRRILEEKLGHKVDLLAYPYGHHNVFVNSLARLAGYRKVMTTRNGLLENPKHFAWPRMDLNGDSYALSPA